jgi:hypothetical protein
LIAKLFGSAQEGDWERKAIYPFHIAFMYFCQQTKRASKMNLKPSAVIL